MEKIDIAYISGVVDGEGCIGLNVNKCKSYSSYRIKVAVCNTNEWICRRLKSYFGGCVSKEIRNGNRKPIWIWFISGNKALMCLNVIYPYLHIKKPQAKIAIKYQSTRNHKKGDNIFAEECRIIMANLNKRGLVKS